MAPVTAGTPVVYGKETFQPRCVKDTDYMFFAKRGTNNKVLMYYQGGGACWDALTCGFAGQIFIGSKDPLSTCFG